MGVEAPRDEIVDEVLPESSLPARFLVRLLSAPEGSLDWAVGIRIEIQDCASRPESDQAYVARCLKLLLRTKGWRLLKTAAGTPFRSFEDFCHAARPFGLGLTKAEVKAVLD